LRRCIVRRERDAFCLSILRQHPAIEPSGWVVRQQVAQRVCTPLLSTLLDLLNRRTDGKADGQRVVDANLTTTTKTTALPTRIARHQTVARHQHRTHIHRLSLLVVTKPTSLLLLKYLFPHLSLQLRSMRRSRSILIVSST